MFIIKNRKLWVYAILAVLLSGGYADISALSSQNNILPGLTIITKAEHLDANKQLVSDISNKVQDLDGNWSEIVSDSHYVRVTFEKSLHSNNDIAIYPRIISGNPKIEVYEKDGTKLIAESTIQSNQYNKIFLTSLQEKQDTFDLKISGGSVELDQVIDPWPLPTYVGAGATASSINAITPALPSGIQSNDILILFVETANQAISISNQNGGTWTEITNSPQGTGTAGATGATRLTAFWSRYNGVQGAPTTSDSGNHQLGVILAFRGVISAGNPWDITSGNVGATSNTSLSANGATTTTGNTLVVVAAALDSNTPNFGATWTNVNLANILLRSNVSTAVGNAGRLGVVTGEKATVGAYGATTNTLTAASVKGLMTIALRPPLPVAPTLSISQPDGIGDTVVAGSTYNITYSLSDPDDVVTVAFYYDTNNSGLDGTAISGACATAPEGSGVTCAWNTTGMASGSYYVYGIANDGTNPAVNAYSPGQITIITVPGAPTGLGATAVSEAQINLSWTAPASNGGSAITGYKIERESPVGGGWSTLVANTGSTSTTYSDTGLSPATQYNYRVSAINAAGTGSPSNTADTTTTMTVSSQSRNPPRIEGIGIFTIHRPENLPESYGSGNQTNHFEDYFKYSIQSNVIDHQLYGNNYVKSGQFFNKENFDKTQPTFVQNHGIIQIQTPILDEYKGSKMEHVSLYFQNEPNKPNSETWISFDKPKGVQTSDPQKIFGKVNASYSLENDYFWAIFSIEFDKPISSGILIEGWHESKTPVYEFVPNIISGDSKFSENQAKLSHMARVNHV